MKRLSLFLIFLFIAIAFLFLLKVLTREKSSTEQLASVLHELEQIKSATYNSKTEGWAPGDSVAFYISQDYRTEFDNPKDTTIGASFVSLKQNDTTQMTFSYDGYMRTTVDEEYKLITVDSFNIRKLPFRPLNPPFFNYAKSIIRYALETEDSISVYMEDLDDELYFKIELLEDKPLEFFGKPYSIINPYQFEKEISIYEVWIDKSTDLPCKIRRERTNDISVRTCSNVELNKLRIEDFRASDYFQSDYSIESYRMGPGPGKIKIEGTSAPEWSLTDAENNIFALNELKSKVVLIQFTSVSCGPCMASIPFLKELVKEYDPKDFDLIAIEAFTQNSNVLKSYQRRKDITYPFLMSSKELNKSYQIQAVPVFFVLDENRVIQKVIRGYAPSVNEQLRNAINELI